MKGLYLLLALSVVEGPAGEAQAAAQRPIEKAEMAFELGRADEALRLIKPLVKQGDAEALVLLGRMHETGQGAPKDVGEAVKLYRRASAKLHPAGRYHLARVYLLGVGVERDPQRALKMATAAAEAGYPPAMSMLGGMYSQGDAVERDYTQAVTWYERASAAGDKEGQYALGLMYLSGVGLPKQIANAASWLKRAAEQGHPLAQHLYGLLLSGTGEGVTPDLVQAYSWLALAAGRGVKDAQPKLADLEKRLSRPQLAEARKRTASMARDLAQGRKAGEGAPIPKPRQPADDAREAFDSGKYARARSLAEPLAKAGDPVAAYLYGLLLERGLGGAKDQAAGLEHMRKAADIGFPAAQYNLGVIYENGNSATKPDLMQAYIWYTLASAQGDEDARDKGAALIKILSAEELLEAKERITAWVETYRKRTSQK